MSETFVDLTYRGLPLGSRARLAEVRPSTGYVELGQPMPVGTTIAIAADGVPAIAATVVGVREQTTGSERPAGMVVRPQLEDDAARAWWKERVTLPELEKPRPVRPAAQPPPVPQVVVVQKRVTKPGIGVPVPELVDDGNDTGVMDAVDPELLEDEPAAIESAPVVVDDGKQTTAMEAADLAALGLEAVASGEDEDGNGNGSGNGNGNGNGSGNGNGNGAAKKKKRKKR